MSTEAAREAGRREGRRSRGESGGAVARRALRRGAKAVKHRFITRSIPVYRTLSEEALELIEGNADTVLEEIGIDVLHPSQASHDLDEVSAFHEAVHRLVFRHHANTLVHRWVVAHGLPKHRDFTVGHRGEPCDHAE